MKLNEVLNDYDDYGDDDSDSLQVTFTLIAPEEYEGSDGSAEVTVDVDVDVEETEYEGPHVFSQGGFEVSNAWFANDYMFMGHDLQKGMDMPLQYVPYIDFSEDDIRAMGETPTPDLREDEMGELFAAFLQNRIQSEVKIPERRYPAQR